MTIKRAVVVSLTCVFASVSFASDEDHQDIKQTYREYGVSKPEQKNLQEMWEDAQSASRIILSKGAGNPPPVFVLTEEQLAQKICPESPSKCGTMAAIYDTDTGGVFVRQDVANLDGDKINKSFIVHEFVHALQHRRLKEKGISEEVLYNSCENLYNTERQAYDAQNIYLRGELFIAGRYVMRYTFCNGKTLDETKSAGARPPIETKPAMASRGIWYNPWIPLGR